MFTLRTPLLLMAVLFIFGMGCQPCPTCDDNKVPDGYKLVKIAQLNTTTTVSDSVAVAWTTEWRNKMAASGSFLTSDPIRAFEIPHQDMAGVITHPKSRAYLAYEADLVNPKYHLVIVGVDAQGKDDTSVIYDLTVPCPTVCDTRSILNQ